MQGLFYYLTYSRKSRIHFWARTLGIILSIGQGMTSVLGITGYE